MSIEIPTRDQQHGGMKLSRDTIQGLINKHLHGAENGASHIWYDFPGIINDAYSLGWHNRDVLARQRESAAVKTIDFRGLCEELANHLQLMTAREDSGVPASGYYSQAQQLIDRARALLIAEADRAEQN